jgi:hypothetical protein
MGEQDHRARRISAPVTEVFAAITLRDRDAAIEFYEHLLGAPPTMPVRPLTTSGRVVTTPGRSLSPQRLTRGGLCDSDFWPTRTAVSHCAQR